MNSFQMPNVFVIPPEEDHSPAWCYFDATKRQLDLFDSTLIPIEANISPASRNAIIYAIDQHTNDCVENDINYDCEAELHFEQGLDFLELGDQPLQESHVPACSPWINYRDVGDDSDVAEVIKIRRRDEESERIGHSEQTAEVTRSQTLKSRASKVFHSLKRVGKRKSTKLPRTRDNVAFPASLFFMSSHTVGTSEKDSGPRTLPKRSSILVSEIFTPTTGPRSSFSRAEECIILSTSQSNPPLPTSQSPDTGISFFHEHDRMHGDRQMFPPRTVFPNPSFRNKSRFSKINIQKLFSFATSTSSPGSTSSTILGCSPLSNNDDTVLAPVGSEQRQGVDYIDNIGKPFFQHQFTTDVAITQPSSSTTVSTITREKHSGFVHDGYNPTELELDLGGDLNLEFGVELEVPIASQMSDALSSQSHIACKADGKTQGALDDDSFEMCLDSLRFDDLSFDVNTFRL
ncbi:hypothetical protein APHAL10511_006998 [Amanita phalloides]|nr:hypothetical protein APHAL10511_006998 [Amanita phalloides]